MLPAGVYVSGAVLGVHWCPCHHRLQGWPFGSRYQPAVTCGRGGGLDGGYTTHRHDIGTELALLASELSGTAVRTALAVLQPLWTRFAMLVRLALILRRAH
ncbi:hypothetical protein WY02_25870 [Pseudonocardia sp. AL041005-10]|nr:hypothetical protein WY02_25870 [Pseudonocardia sp. AL041005-10]